MSNGPDEFDLGDLGGPADPGVLPEAEQERQDWAEKALRPPAVPAALASGRAAGGYASFDIETGPLSWPEIEPFYEAPAAIAPFDEAAVKYGNTKDPAKCAVILEAARAKHATMLADEGATREAHKQKFIDEAALSAITGRVLAIGIFTNEEASILSDWNGEKSLLELFWDQHVSRWLESKTIIIGHNSTGFDWPFLIRRSWRLGVEVPRDLMQGRYLNPLCKDTQTVWNCGERGYVKLDFLARFFGVGGKPDDCTGATFAKLWAGSTEEKERAMAYLKNDIEMTWAVAKCLGMIV